MTTAPNRAPDSSVLPVILNRWSPRAFLPEAISKEELLALIDAGRWAPSAYNMQPWRFIYARRGTPEWERFLSWLIPFNQSWAENASAIIYVASQTITLSSRTGEPTPLPTHAFDAGAAAVLIQIQAAHNGWATHPVSGFDHALAHAGLELPEEYELHAAIILGRQGKVETLPESLQKREIPSDRNALDTLSFERRWHSPKEAETDN
ncbi:nitroreductase [Acetobacter pasteurianus NBRC 3280]|uniref:Nitroreductase n=2 Tax=Acetobacter pasteurianus TaxID=438 RepID=A0A401X377_ACEPA|nr:nitroreductase family protein [Acetobacter pasteurianus]GCD58736.1 nitroreductase [Acetobacter pasteurianus NBRC 3277]GCD62229.1 nitroreductase [Acetobacter pasteurianus NBRC 3278]GCD68603.1 nitroreductase [Acetobacter pasteurianus NBRC 3280]